MHLVDAHWRTVLSALPVRFHEVAAELPYRLGLSPDPTGLWTDFTKLEPMCDLPAFAAEDPSNPGRPLIEGGALQRFREAHCDAGYFGLLVDRLADGQSRPHPDLARLRPTLRSVWVRALGEAMRDETRARELIRHAVHDWRAGLRRDARHKTPGGWRARDYGDCVRDKTRWLAATSVGLLEATGQRARVDGFLEAFDGMLLALQALDDGLDAADDYTLRGLSYPATLGVSPDALVRAASLLCVRAAERAARHGFHALSTWLSAHARTVREVSVKGHPVAVGLEAMIFVEELLAAG